MKENIKSIIEDYIDYIETDEWETIFKKWYVDASRNPAHLVRPEWSEILTGDVTIKSFFTALEEAGIEGVEQRTLKIRQNTIKEEASKTIDKLVGSAPNNSLYFQGFKMHMNTFLGLEESYVRKLFSDLCIQKGMTPATPNSKAAYIKES